MKKTSSFGSSKKFRKTIPIYDILAGIFNIRVYQHSHLRMRHWTMLYHNNDLQWTSEISKLIWCCIFVTLFVITLSMFDCQATGKLIKLTIKGRRNANYVKYQLFLKRNITIAPFIALWGGCTRNRYLMIDISLTISFFNDSPPPSD